jgi:hypothetical protein
MNKQLEVLLCYRGRFSAYISELLEQLRTLGIRVTYDSEILAGEASADAAADIDWYTLDESSQPQEDTAWRAPLHEAIGSAELVVFAIEIRDISANVLNEIRWAIQQDVHVFFLAHGPAKDAVGESGGVMVGMLAAMYMFVRQSPEYPEFGFHSFEDLEGEARRADVVVAANRIAAHLARVRKGPLNQLSGDNDVTVADLQKRPEVKARRHLHGMQEKIYRLLLKTEPAAASVSPFDEAVKKLRAREQEESRLGRSDRRLECLSRAEEILSRIQPSAFEATHYITTLVAQAAAVEEMIHADIQKQRADALDFRPPILIGTIFFSNLPEPACLAQGDDYSIILVDRQFIDFLYQVIKVCMLENIRTGPEIADGFYACIRRYAVQGMPDASSKDAPLQIHQPLGEYLRLSERFMLGRAYALVGASGGGWPRPETDPDLLALVYSVRSARFIDEGDPLSALSGAVFLCVAEHLRTVMCAVLDPNGREREEQEAVRLEQRIENLTRHYERRMLDAGAPAELASECVAKARKIGTTPLRLWKQVLPRLREEQRQGVRAAVIWS